MIISLIKKCILYPGMDMSVRSTVPKKPPSLVSLFGKNIIPAFLSHLNSCFLTFPREKNSKEVTFFFFLTLSSFCVHELGFLML